MTVHPRILRPGAVMLAGLWVVTALVSCDRVPERVSRPLPIGPAMEKARPAPPPSDPIDALRLFAWCWNHRDANRYREIFSDDVVFTCAISDSTGTQVVSLLRDDLLQSATRFFATSRNLRLDLPAHLVALPDPRPGRTAGWHQQIVTRLPLRAVSRSLGPLRVDGVARFFVVRGDSALIPLELRAMGFTPDPTRWYIERWEVEDASAGPPSTRRGHGVTALDWCEFEPLTR